MQSFLAFWSVLEPCKAFQSISDHLRVSQSTSANIARCFYQLLNLTTRVRTRRLVLSYLMTHSLVTLTRFFAKKTSKNKLAFLGQVESKKRSIDRSAVNNPKSVSLMFFSLFFLLREAVKKVRVLEVGWATFKDGPRALPFCSDGQMI